MKKSILSIIKSMFFFIILYIYANSTYAQPECRSILGAHLTPIHKKIPLSWAIEETFAQGWMRDRNITNNLLFVGLDFTIKSHSLYFEGGPKMWRNSLGKYGNNSKPINFSLFKRGKLGFREMFYKYSHNSTNLIIGLHTTTLDDYFLVDERTVGIDFKQNFGALGINANFSTVMEDFTRMGNYCTVKYIYNTIKGKKDPYIGEAFGETNFASFIISWTPSNKKNNDNEFEEFNNDNNEFEEFNENNNEFEEFNENNNEFEEFKDDNNEFNNNKISEKKNKKFQFKNPINKYGLVLYEEFGDSIIFNKHYFGFFVGFDLPLKFNLEIETLEQLISTTHTIGYFIRLKKNINWQLGNSSFIVSYTGKYPSTTNSIFEPSYANLFMGEIIRLDVWDMPIISASAKHSFNVKLKPHIRIKLTEQLQYPNTGAIDIEFGIKFWKHCKFTTILSRIHSKALMEDNYMARVELRIAF